MVHVQNRTSTEIDGGICDQVERAHTGSLGTRCALQSAPRNFEWLKAIPRSSQLVDSGVGRGFEETVGEPKKVKILIIEDDRGMAAALKNFLQPLTSNITIANQMDEALRIVADAEELHLITVDLGLPDSDVRSTIRRISDIRKNKPDSLIIVVTGQDIPGLEADSIASGADGFVFKQGDNFTSQGFLKVIGVLVAKFMSKPSHYNRSLTLLEQVSNKLAEIRKHENPTSDTGVATA